MFKLVLASACTSLVGAAGWNHLASFNDGCGADLSFLRGTDFETSATVGKLPAQFKTAFAEVMKARVAMESCTLTTQQQALFYGLEPINFLRLFDAYDTELNNTAFPCANVANLKWSWQKAKWDMEGILLPTSCRSAAFATSKQCDLKFRLVDNLNLEIHYADKCSDPNQPGFGLPQISVSCSGSMCSTFMLPCVPGSNTCGTGTCHTFTGSELSNTMQFLLDTGLFNNITDTSCTSGGFSFPEQIFSDVINNVANMLGLTSSVSTDRYSSLSLCGVGELDTRFNPSDAPTPAPMFQCPTGARIPYSSVCDGMNDCPGSEDESYCRCNMTGIIDSSTGSFYSCCPICMDYPNGNCWNQFCGRDPVVHTSVQICNHSASGWGMECPDISASSQATIPSASPLSYASTSNANDHLLAFADCSGNVQVGNTNDMFVGNAKLPFQKVLGRAENILKAREPCRSGTAPGVSEWKRYFFPWAVNFWGGNFLTTQALGNIFGNVNPGVKIDDSMRFYSGVDGMYNTVPPPFSNIENAPTSCDATTTSNGLCEIALNISEWFGGSFPQGWDSPTTAHLKVSSSCANSAVPEGVITCEGPCTSTSKSGCCMMKEPFLPTNNYACPQGYTLDTLQSSLTDFLFNLTSTHSQDMTVMNFLALVVTRSSSFGTGAGQTPFINPGLGASTQFCRVNGTSFGNNTQAWGNRTATDNCPYPPVGQGNGSRVCPQILAGGGVLSCAGCVQGVGVSQCPASGCPSTGPSPTPGINGAVSAGLSLAAAAVAMLAL